MDKDPLTRWKWGKRGEIAFWRGWLQRRGVEYEGPRQLRSELVELVDGLSKVRIANLGAGAMSLIGNLVDGKDIEVVASDLLADEYAVLREELGLQPVIDVERQDMRCLTYEDRSFDVVFCANALDHCQDPRQAIMEMIRICRGQVYLRHLPHEAKWCGYTGLHQWNIDALPDGDCEFWTRKRAQVFLLSSCGKFETSVLPSGRRNRIISILKGVA